MPSIGKLRTLPGSLYTLPRTGDTSSHLAYEAWSQSVWILASDLGQASPPLALAYSCVKSNFVSCWETSRNPHTAQSLAPNTWLGHTHSRISAPSFLRATEQCLGLQGC